MRDFLYLLVVLLVIGWVFGAFIYPIGSVIHVVLVVAVILLLFRLIDNNRKL